MMKQVTMKHSEKNHDPMERSPLTFSRILAITTLVAAPLILSLALIACDFPGAKKDGVTDAEEAAAKAAGMVKEPELSALLAELPGRLTVVTEGGGT